MEHEPHPEIGDALGLALLTHLEEGGSAEVHIVERDDGYIDVDPADVYFSTIGGWFAVEKSSLDRVHGRVLDIGAGAGRFAVAAQNRGRDVVALDVSAGCLEVCRRRGVRETFYGTIFDLAAQNPEPFDTFLLMGHNLGLLAGPEQASPFFDALRSMANPRARIIGTNREPLATEDPVHLAYHQQNRERGRPPAQLSIRVRWRQLATPWFDYWFFSIAELESLGLASGWELVGSVEAEGHYLAELRMVG